MSTASTDCCPLCGEPVTDSCDAVIERPADGNPDVFHRLCYTRDRGRFTMKVRLDNTHGTKSVTLPKPVCDGRNIQEDDRITLQIIDIEKADAAD